MQRVVKELAKVVGLGDAIELVRRWGGRELYVPVKVQPGDPLALTLGLDTARKLVDTYGGQRLQLPAERNALLELRNAAIVAAHQAGKSTEQIGLEFGLTRQAVNLIIRNIREREEIRKKFAGRQAGSNETQSPAHA
jgi:Mor family transcriptional regulator